MMDPLSHRVKDFNLAAMLKSKKAVLRFLLLVSNQANGFHNKCPDICATC